MICFTVLTPNLENTRKCDYIISRAIARQEMEAEFPSSVQEFDCNITQSAADLSVSASSGKFNELKCCQLPSPFNLRRYRCLVIDQSQGHLSLVMNSYGTVKLL